MVGRVKDWRNMSPTGRLSLSLHKLRLPTDPKIFYGHFLVAPYVHAPYLRASYFRAAYLHAPNLRAPYLRAPTSVPPTSVPLPTCRVYVLILTLLCFRCIIGIPSDNLSFEFSLFFKPSCQSYHLLRGPLQCNRQPW